MWLIGVSPSAHGGESASVSMASEALPPTKLVGMGIMLVQVPISPVICITKTIHAFFQLPDPP
jgi:hypothetical protein